MKIFMYMEYYNTLIQIKNFKFHSKNIIIQLINNLDSGFSIKWNSRIYWKVDISNSVEEK